VIPHLLRWREKVKSGYNRMAGSEKQETENKKQETRNRKRETGSEEQETRNPFVKRIRCLGEKGHPW
jgi:hypothetical protein